MLVTDWDFVLSLKEPQILTLASQSVLWKYNPNKGDLERWPSLGMLQAIGEAYGEPTIALTMFRANFLGSWSTTGINWPRKDRTDGEELKRISQELCTNLRATRERAEDSLWSNEKLQHCLDVDLVHPTTRHYHHGATLSYHFAQRTGLEAFEKTFKSIHAKWHRNGASQLMFRHHARHFLRKCPYYACGILI